MLGKQRFVYVIRVPVFMPKDRLKHSFFHFLFHLRIAQAYEEFGLLIGHESQLVTKPKEIQVGVKKLPMVSVEICVRNTSTEQASDQTVNGDASIAEENPALQSIEIPIGSPKRCLDTANITPLSLSSSLGEISSVESFDANADVAADAAEADYIDDDLPHDSTEITSNEASVDGTFNSCPSLVDVTEPHNENDFYPSPLYSPVSFPGSQCNDSFNEAHIGLIDESFEENVNSCGISAIHGDANQPEYLEPESHTYYSPRFGRSLHANLMMPPEPAPATAPAPAPVLPESTPEIPWGPYTNFFNVRGLPNMSNLMPEFVARRPMAPSLPRHWNYQLFPPMPHLHYPFHHQ